MAFQNETRAGQTGRRPSPQVLDLLSTHLGMRKQWKPSASSQPSTAIASGGPQFQPGAHDP